MINSFFFISSNGDVLIEKHWRGISPRSLCEFFWEEVNKYDHKEDMPPVVVTSKYYLISALREGNFLLATTTGETSPLVAIEFLHRVFDIFAEYFGDVEETTIKENFATVYQLLEEMVLTCSLSITIFIIHHAHDYPTLPFVHLPLKLISNHFVTKILCSNMLHSSRAFISDGLRLSINHRTECTEGND